MSKRANSQPWWEGDAGGIWIACFPAFYPASIILNFKNIATITKQKRPARKNILFGKKEF